MHVYIYRKFGKELKFDKYEAWAGRGLSSDRICYKESIIPDSINICDIGNVLDGKVILTDRDDKKASDIFADYYSREIERLQGEIIKLQAKQKTNKVSWFREGIGTLEEMNVDF